MSGTHFHMSTNVLTLGIVELARLAIECDHIS
jgi:hypothetical protein